MESVIVDGDGEGRADFVSPGVPAADAPRLVVLSGVASLLEGCMDLAGFLREAVPGDKGIDLDLYGGKTPG